jgi:hypothetical protein
VKKKYQFLLESKFVLRFFSARQDSEIILPRTLKMHYLASERDNKVFFETQSFFGFELGFQDYFGNPFSFSDLSQIYKIRNSCKFPSLFWKNTLIPSSFFNFLELLFKLPINSKLAMKIFRAMDFHSLETSSLDIQNQCSEIVH